VTLAPAAVAKTPSVSMLTGNEMTGTSPEGVDGGVSNIGFDDSSFLPSDFTSTVDGPTRTGSVEILTGDQILAIADSITANNEAIVASTNDTADTAGMEASGYGSPEGDTNAGMQEAYDASQFYDNSGYGLYGDSGGNADFNPDILPAANGGAIMSNPYAMAKGGSLGGYSDGGQLLRGPGDGVSDSIPASIGKQPARLADGEFVIPARIVSELGNGSTEAGSRQLYAMLERIQAGRSKSTGRGKVATNTRAAKHLPA